MGLSENEVPIIGIDQLIVIIISIKMAICRVHLHFQTILHFGW